PDGPPAVSRLDPRPSLPPSASGHFPDASDRRRRCTMLDIPTSAAKPLVNADSMGRSAIVTGSTSGIGLGVARAFAACGMNVLLNGFGDRAEIDRTVAELAAEHGVRTAYSAADMSRPDDIARMVDETTETFGAVDVLVNNAGIQHVEAVETFPIDKWNAIVAIDL